MKKLILILPFFALMQVYAQNVRLKKDDLKELASRMKGVFSNNEQATRDAGYQNAVWRIKPIWLTNLDGYWFYIEQADLKNQQKPSGQMVWHIYLQDHFTVICKTYEIKSPGQYAGAWNDESKLYHLAEEGLINRNGCDVYLHKNKEGNYNGSTLGKECPGSVPGALYVTTELTINNDRIVSWEKQWDISGKQVGGFEKGEYILIKSRD